MGDGEELLLSEGEAFRIRPEPVPAVSAVREAASGAPRPIAIQYVGFQDVGDRREYRFDVRRGEMARRYTVWIELAAFSRRQALLQDGPDICYQKLVRDVASSQMQGPDAMGATENDLAAYRETHTPPGRKSFTPARPSQPMSGDREGSPAKSGETA